jgi:uncharacterized protein (TIGR03435 family)
LVNLGVDFSVASIKPASQVGRDVEGLGFVNTLPGWLVGGPAWIHSAHYNIEAKAEGNPDEAQMLKMAQKLLEDRFQLKLHRETRELPVYILSPAPSGFKVASTPGGNCNTNEANEAPPSPGHISVGVWSREWMRREVWNCGLKAHP